MQLSLDPHLELFQTLRRSLEDLRVEMGGRFRLKTDFEHLVVTCAPSRPDEGTATISSRVDHDSQLFFAVGRATHYDTYASGEERARELVAEALDNVRSVVLGHVVEKVWLRKNGEVAQTRLLYVDQGETVAYYNGLFTRRRGAPSVYEYRPYPLPDCEDRER